MMTFLSNHYSAEKINLLFFSGVSAIVKLLVGFITIKLFAVFIGPEGLALTGNMSNLITLLMTIATLGISSGVVKYIAEFKNDLDQLKSIISTGFIIILITSSFTSIIVLLFSAILSEKILYSSDYVGVMLLLGLSLPLTMLNLFFANILNGHKSLKKLALVNVVIGAFAILTITLFVWWWGLKGAFISLIISSAVSFIITCFIVRKEYWFSKEYFFSHFNINSFKSFLAFSVMAGVSALIIPFTQFYIRNLIIEKLSISAAGEWEAINRMSNAYLSVITASLSVYYLPRLSEIKKRSELMSEIIQMALLILPLLFLLQVFIYIFRDKVVNVLFSAEFVTVESLFVFQLIGDFFRVASWILAYIIIARALVKMYIYTEILSAICYLSFVYILIQNNGLSGVVLAYMADFVFYFLLLLVLLKFSYSKGRFL